MAHGLDPQGMPGRTIEWHNDAGDFEHRMPDCFQAKALECACEKLCFDQSRAVAEGHELHQLAVGLVVSAIRHDKPTKRDAAADVFGKVCDRAVCLPGNIGP